MPFTSPSVANKGNLFHISPGNLIFVKVQELVTFHILENAILLIPVFDTWPDPKHKIIEAIMTPRVQKTNCLSTENILVTYVPVGFSPIGSLKNIITRYKIITIRTNNMNKVLILYLYEFQVLCVDPLGRTTTVKLTSGCRCQEVVVNHDVYRMEVDITINYLGAQIGSRNIIQQSLQQIIWYKPTRIFITAVPK